MNIPVCIKFFLATIAFLCVTIYGFITGDMLVAIAGASQGIGCAFMSIATITM